MYDEEDLVRRAAIAHKKSGGMEQPAKESGVEVAGGNSYVVLRNVAGVVGVYLIKPDGALQRQEDVPEGIAS